MTEILPGINNLDLFGIGNGIDSPLSEIEEWLKGMEYPWTALRNLDDFVAKIIQKKKDFTEDNKGLFPFGIRPFCEEKCFPEPYCFVEGFVYFGESTKVKALSYYEKDVIFGKNCTIESSCQITGPAVFGDNVHLHHGVTITGCSKNGPKSVLVGNNVNIYPHAVVKASIIMDGANIYSGSYMPISIVGPNARVGSQNSLDDIKTNDNQSSRSIVIHYKLESLATELTRMGTIIGANTKLESGVTADPETIVAPNKTIPRGETIRGIIGVEK